MKKVYQIVEIYNREIRGKEVKEFGLPCNKKSVFSDADEKGLLRLYEDRSDAEKKLMEFDRNYSSFQVVEMKLI